MGNKNSKGFFKFKGLNNKDYSLTLQQKLFCELYLEYFGNGVEAIIGAGYDVNFKNSKGKDTGNPNRRLAAAIASENLTKPNIIAYIDLKLEEYGFSDDNVKKQHLFNLNQFADLTAKNKAIDMFYKLKGKYAAEKVEHDVSNNLRDLILGDHGENKRSNTKEAD